MTATVVIDERFCGPPDSANGGYACAMAARWLNGPAEVTLRTPPPLGQPLDVEENAEGVALLTADEVLVAEALPTTVDLDVPDGVSFDSATRAASRYPWRDRHPYPTCFVCGPERDHGDGLEIFPGPVDDGSLYAAPWTPDPSLTDSEGNVCDEFVWGGARLPERNRHRSVWRGRTHPPWSPSG